MREKARERNSLFETFPFASLFVNPLPWKPKPKSIEYDYLNPYKSLSEISIYLLLNNDSPFFLRFLGPVCLWVQGLCEALGGVGCVDNLGISCVVKPMAFPLPLICLIGGNIRLMSLRASPPVLIIVGRLLSMPMMGIDRIWSLRPPPWPNPACSDWCVVTPKPLVVRTLSLFFSSLLLWSDGVDRLYPTSSSLFFLYPPLIISQLANHICLTEFIMVSSEIDKRKKSMGTDDPVSPMSIPRKGLTQPEGSKLPEEFLFSDDGKKKKKSISEKMFWRLVTNRHWLIVLLGRVVENRVAVFCLFLLSTFSGNPVVAKKIRIWIRYVWKLTSVEFQSNPYSINYSVLRCYIMKISRMGKQNLVENKEAEEFSFSNDDVEWRNGMKESLDINFARGNTSTMMKQKRFIKMKAMLCLFWYILLIQTGLSFLFVWVLVLISVCITLWMENFCVLWLLVINLDDVNKGDATVVYPVVVLHFTMGYDVFLEHKDKSNRDLFQSITPFAAPGTSLLMYDQLRLARTEGLAKCELRWCLNSSGKTSVASPLLKGITNKHYGNEFFYL